MVLSAYWLVVQQEFSHRWKDYWAEAIKQNNDDCVSHT